MNIITKGSIEILKKIMNENHDFHIKVLYLSGNYCIDKKPSAINWILGCCKSITCEALINLDDLKNIMNVKVDDLINLNVTTKFGGFNAHASNIIYSIFISRFRTNRNLVLCV